MGHGPRGLLGRRRRVGLVHLRPGAVAGVPLGRGRPARDQRRRRPAVLRAGSVERRRPDPQGAAVRADRAAGQPRRGRQGGLPLPRRDAEPLLPEGALSLSAARVPVRATSSRRTPAAAGTSPSSSWPTRASSTTGAGSTSSSSTPRPRPRTSSSGSRRRTADRRPRRSTCCRLCGSGTRGRGAATRAPGRRCARATPVAGGVAVAASHRAARRLPPRGRRLPCPPVHRERLERRGAVGRAERVALRQGRDRRDAWSMARRGRSTRPGPARRSPRTTS